MPKKKRKTKTNKPKSKKLLIIMSVLFLILLPLGATLTVYGNNVLVPDGQHEKDQILSKYRGTLTPAFSIDLSQRLNVSVGSNTYSFTADELSSGIDLVDKVFHMENVVFPV